MKTGWSNRPSYLFDDAQIATILRHGATGAAQDFRGSDLFAADLLQKQQDALLSRLIITDAECA